jgi:CRISPR-associated protein, csm2 family
MKIDELNYVDTANNVILALKNDDKFGKLTLTTSKIRNLLSMTSALYTDAQQQREDKLSTEMQSRVQYLRMRAAYEAGRDQTVKSFVVKAELLEQLSAIRDDRKKLLLFCRYMEALVAYHRFHGGD